VAQPTRQAAPPGPVWPSVVASPPSSYVRLHFDRKRMPYFFHNFLRQQQRWNPSSTSRRSDLLLPPKGNRCHCYHRLLLSVGGASLSHLQHHLHHRQHQDHLHLEIRHHPLIVCGRSNTGYCLSVLCMFVLDNLSLFFGEVILSDCIIPYMKLIMIMFDTCE
jgi:hypothetical protein